jgi:H/ACA ribonucleoprotein complex subunit 3
VKHTLKDWGFLEGGSVNFGMVKLLKKCVDCHQYSLAKEICPACDGHLRVAAPPKFSPQDKYGKYRRMLLKTTLSIHREE